MWKFDKIFLFYKAEKRNFVHNDQLLKRWPVPKVRALLPSADAHLKVDIGWMIQARETRCLILVSFMKAFLEPNSFIASRLSVGPKICCSWFFTQPDLNSLFTEVLRKEISWMVLTTIVILQTRQKVTPLLSKKISYDPTFVTKYTVLLNDSLWTKC